MKTPLLVASLAVVAALFVPGNSSAKTASCPCSPCKCSPCTCGGSGGKHHSKDHGHGGGSSVGVGVSVDLSGVGHRTREADPFAAGSGSDKPVSHTEEKRTTKKKEREPTTTGFDEIKLTGKEAKDENNPPNTFNVDNEEPPKLPPSEVFTPKAPSDPMEDLKKAHDDYHKACSDWLKKQQNWNSLVHDWTQSPNTEEGNRKSAKAKQKIDNLMKQFDAGDGKQLVDDW